MSSSSRSRAVGTGITIRRVIKNWKSGEYTQRLLQRPAYRVACVFWGISMIITTGVLGVEYFHPERTALIESVKAKTEQVEEMYSFPADALGLYPYFSLRLTDTGLDLVLKAVEIAEYIGCVQELKEAGTPLEDQEIREWVDKTTTETQVLKDLTTTQMEEVKVLCVVAILAIVLRLVGDILFIRDRKKYMKEQMTLEEKEKQEVDSVVAMEE